MPTIQDKATGRMQEYRSRLDVIRNSGMNHMSRTRTKIDKFTSSSNRINGVKSTGRRKAKAYDGAYVAETRRQVPSGFKMAGQLMQHIHDFVIDMDLTSLYPSIMILLNLSPKTFVGKIFFKDKIQIPKYQIAFIDAQEAKEYKMNAHDYFMETLVGKHDWAIAEIFLKLPATEEILDHIAEHQNKFLG